MILIFFRSITRTTKTSLEKALMEMILCLFINTSVLQVGPKFICHVNACL